MLLKAEAEPEAIAHHFTEAGVEDRAIEWWGKAGDQALHRSAFQEAIAHLGKAIALADAQAGANPQHRRSDLRVAYGNALIAARGHGAPETTEAFARAREFAADDKDAPERLAADWGVWVGSFLRGELPSMRLHAEAFLNDIEAIPDSPEAGVAHRAAGKRIKPDGSREIEYGIVDCSEAAIKTDDTGLGELVSVSLLLSIDTGGERFGFFLPYIDVPSGQTAHFHTVGIYKTFSGPDSVPHRPSTWRCIELSGTAQTVDVPL